MANELVVERSAHVERIEDEEFVIDRYTIERCLGEGNFAVVSKCVHAQEQSVWAMKEVDLHRVAGQEFCIENEVHLLFECHHDCIIGIREAFMTPYSYFIIVQYIENGDLLDAIKRDGRLSDGRAARVVHDAASALAYLHKRNIVHRDVKPENLLLTVDYRARLCDFGLACKIGGDLRRVCGSPSYVAPEILAETGYRHEVDLWSLGVIMHTLLCGDVPFAHVDKKELFTLIRQGDVSMSNSAWASVDEDAKRLLRRLLRRHVPSRITARRVLLSKWITRHKL